MTKQENQRSSHLYEVNYLSVKFHGIENIKIRMDLNWFKTLL